MLELESQKQVEKARTSVEHGRIMKDESAHKSVYKYSDKLQWAQRPHGDPDTLVYKLLSMYGAAKKINFAKDSNASALNVLHLAHVGTKSQGNALHQLHRSFTANSDYYITQCLGCKSSFAVCEVVLAEVNIKLPKGLWPTHLPFSSEHLNFLFAHTAVLSY